MVDQCYAANLEMDLMETNFLADIHPKVVHFPIALLTTYSLLEIFGIASKKEFISKAAFLVLCLGLVSSLFAVLTGNQAADNFIGWTVESKKLLNSHQDYATYLLWFTFFICSARIYIVIKKKFSGFAKYIFVLFAIILLFLVFQTGNYGGNLVKKFGIGTDLIFKNDVE